MNGINMDTTVGEIVRVRPACSRIFEKLGIDYCCGGKQPLATACQAKGLDAATVIAMLSALEGAAETPQTNPETMTLAELCDHIQQLHHGYLREELPRLDFLTRKVAAVHGEHEPRLADLRATFERFNAEMTEHTNEEDEVVFPAIRKLAAGGQAPQDFAFPAALQALEREHQNAGAALDQFRTLTDNYTPPDWACNTFRALYDALAHLEQDMHQHVHKENNVLFPKVVATAASAAPSTAACEAH